MGVDEADRPALVESRAERDERRRLELGEVDRIAVGLLSGHRRRKACHRNSRSPARGRGHRFGTCRVARPCRDRVAGTTLGPGEEGHLPGRDADVDAGLAQPPDLVGHEDASTRLIVRREPAGDDEDAEGHAAIIGETTPAPRRLAPGCVLPLDAR